MADDAAGRVGAPASSAPGAMNSPGHDNAGSPSPAAPAPPMSAGFGQTLAPSLIDDCEGRLSELHWFRTDWQRGGAVTGYADYESDDGAHKVVVKFPVPPRELRWLRHLQPTEHDAGKVVPTLYAGGDSLGQYDLAWVVMERLTHGPLTSAWDGAEFDLMIAAAGRFFAAAEHVPVDQPPREEDWAAIIKRARAHLRDQGVAEEQRWNKALKAMQKKLARTLKVWDARDVKHWCHGDLHLANAMTNTKPPDGPAILFDLACVHAGHWVEDAVYLEHLFWSVPDRLGGRPIVKLIAHQRKALGLNVDDDWARLAAIRRALVAASVPAYLHNEGIPRHVRAALERLEQSLGQLPA